MTDLFELAHLFMCSVWCGVYRNFNRICYKTWWR